MTESELLPEVRFRLRTRKTSVPADLRPAWRMAMLCLIVSHSHGKRCSVEQLHVLSWALRSERAKHLLAQLFTARKTPEEPIVREDPSLQRALRMAIAEGLLSERRPAAAQPSVPNAKAATATASPPYRVTLTANGEKLVAAIEEDPACFRSERQFLEEQRPYLTQSHVRALFSWRW